MYYANMGLPTWALVALASSVVIVGAGAAFLQARFPRVPLFAGVGLVATLAVGVTATSWLGRGSSLRSWLETALPLSVMYGLPAVTSLLTVGVLRRRAVWNRVAWGLVCGAVAAFFAVAAGFAVACGLTGDCL
jgi:hypothetical protein